METYRKPDGDVILDAIEYAEAWKALARPIEKATGSQLMAFDPGLMFGDGQLTWSLPAHIAEALSAALRKAGFG